MIKVVTKDGVSLDLEKTCSFSIEIENPMLDDSGIPCAFSTEITFLPTMTNLKTFGWLDGMMAEPVNKRVAADIYASGLRMFSGVLIYDSIEDGKLKYTFSVVDPGEVLSDKIYNASLYKQRVNHSLYFQIMEDAAMGRMEGFAVPPIIGKNQVADIERGSSKTTDPNVKYRNVFSEYKNPSGDSEMAVFSPAVRISYILAPVLESLGMACPEDWDDIAILGLYAGAESKWGIKYEPNSPSFSGSPEMDVAYKLPDISFLELLQNLLKITCSVIFTDAGEYVIKRKADIVGSTPVHDWSGKISDRCSICTEEAKLYKSGFADDDSSATKNNVSIDGREAIEGVDKLLDIAPVLYSDYSSVLCKETGDIFSGEKYDEPITSYNKIRHQVIMDSIYHNASQVKIGNEEDPEFDATSDFKLVKCLPLTIFSSYGSGNVYACQANVPVVPFPELGADRSSDVYIGLLYRNQLVDKGIYLSGHFGTIVTDWDSEYNAGKSLAPAYLYNNAHKAFAEWITSRRLCLKTDLNLSALDIANFRMYHKVRIQGRNFIVKKLSVTFNAGNDTIESEGEFLGC